MLDNPSAAEVLKACGVDLDELRGVLTDFINEHTPRLAAHSDADTQPTQGFQRVIQRAILHVQSSGKKEVTGANVLVAVFGEKESHAVYFLNQRSVTRLDVVNYIAHGITQTPAASWPRHRRGDVETGAYSRALRVPIAVRVDCESFLCAFQRCFIGCRPIALPTKANLVGQHEPQQC